MSDAPKTVASPATTTAAARQGFKGSCLCGKVAYRVERFAGPFVHCHCRTCRKAHAAAFATTGRVDRAHFQWLQGADALGAYESTPGKLRHFCKHCGSHLMAEWVNQPQVIVRVATLDDDPGQQPKAHIWVSHDAPWLNPSAPIPSWDSIPPANP